MYSLLLANQFISVVLLPDGRKMNFQMIREKQIAHISPLLVSFDIPRTAIDEQKTFLNRVLKEALWSKTQDKGTCNSIV